MIRLLGDMRSYNYVVIPIHDFDQVVTKLEQSTLINSVMKEVLKSTDLSF